MKYTVYSGTNTWGECATALAGLAGLLPLRDGPDIAAYERLFAEAAGCSDAFSLAAGRMALYRILEALDVGPGDEVILPAYTCVVVPNAILYRGAVPVYADIERETFNIDPAGIERLVTPRTRAIIAQHTYGLICDVDAIRAIGDKHGLAVIEDCAHALGAERRGAKAGSLGTVAYFSTDHSKVISTGLGGMITTSDPKLAARLRELQEDTPFLGRACSWRILLTFALEFALFDPRIFRAGRWINRVFARLGLYGYFLDELSLARPSSHPYPARLSSVQARIGVSQLRLLASNLAWRRRAARLYDAARGADLSGAGDEHAFLRYTFLVGDRARWIALFADILDMNVWFTSVAAGRDEELEKIGYRMGSCPRAEDAARRCVNLPTHPRILRPELLAERLRDATDGAGGATT